MSSIRARLVRFFAGRYFTDITPDADVVAMRRRFEDLAAHMRPARHVGLRHARVAGIDCDWLVPAGCDEASVLLYLHGGAYVMGSSRTHRRLVGHVARAAGVRALLPNYRLAPEHRFPAALEDACAVYRELVIQEGPARILLGGDSAGGGLAMATLLALRDAGDRLPAATILLSPWLDLSASGESLTTRASCDPLFHAEDMPAAAAHYCNASETGNPLVSPVYADVGGLPPTFIQVGDHEILLSDSTRLTDRLSEAGGKVTLQIWPEMWHVFQFFVGQMPESGRAIRDIGRFIRRQVASSDS